MKAILTHIALAMALLTICSCGKESLPGQVLEDSPFGLDLGESAQFESGDFRIFFSQLIHDSRCPINARCLVAGEAVVKILIQREGQEATSINLSTSPDGSLGSVADFEGHIISLLDVSPYPDGKAVSSEEYEIQLRIN
ncbi:MAG: hypothetical protein AAFV95_11250 [Bacteroidota bacterium]